MATKPTADDPIAGQVREVLERIASDLTMLTDQQIKILSSRAQRCKAKPACGPSVHIAFKLALEWQGSKFHGALLLPLPEAISLAGFLLMLPADAVAAKRSLSNLDQATKDAMLEIASFVGGATDGALRMHFPRGLSVRSHGCQGLRAGQSPAFPYNPGDELIEGRAQVRIGDFPPFELLLILPVLSTQGAALA